METLAVAAQLAATNKVIDVYLLLAQNQETDARAKLSGFIRQYLVPNVYVE